METFIQGTFLDACISACKIQLMLHHKDCLTNILTSDLYSTFDTYIPDAANTTILTIRPGAQKRAKRQSFLKVPIKVLSNFNRARPAYIIVQPDFPRKFCARNQTFRENFAQEIDFPRKFCAMILELAKYTIQV
jgi:hypothetical protein